MTNPIMNEKAESCPLWNSFDRVVRNPEFTLFSGSYIFEGKLISYHVDKPFVEEDESEECGVYSDDGWAVFIDEEVDTIELACDDDFIDLIKQELHFRFDISHENLSSIDRAELLTQGNNYITLENSPELMLEMRDKGLAA